MPDSKGSLVESFENDEKMKALHDAVERELVDRVCLWSHTFIVYLPLGAAVLLFMNGQENYVNPLIVSLVGILSGFFARNVKMIVSLSFIATAIIRHALSQGCSASLVPAIYGFLPCAFAFIFRSTRAVIFSTVGVLAATFVIFAVDLSGHCTTEPIGPTQKEYIIADRLFPLLVLILGNMAVLVAIVRQSQKALLLHARAARSAARLANVRRDVLHRVTHELRTPLNGIVGSVELLTTSETMNENDMENALTIKSCLQSIVRICDDVLMAAKSRTDDRDRKETVFLLASCVDDVAEIFGAAAAVKGIELRVEFIGNTIVMVRGMEVELRQVLLNLIGNAMKFTDEGSVTIRVKEETPSSLDLVTYMFEVEDTGIGVAKGDSNMLFEAFHQGEQGGAVSRRHKGTGLGLTICKDFVELMGGSIALDGDRDRGARFYFKLSFKKAGMKDESIVRSEARILIADPEKESSETCCSVAKSVAPSSDVTIVRSLEKLADFVATDSASNGMPRVVLMNAGGLDYNFLAPLFASINKAGWLVFVYCDYVSFSRLVANSVDAYVVMRRPLSLVRVGDKLCDALRGVPRRGQSQLSLQEDTTPRLDSLIQESLPGKGSSKDESNREIAKTKKPSTAVSLAKNSVPAGTNGVKESSSTGPSVTKKEKPKRKSVELRPGSKVVVVDDTPVNVKVLVKMLSRSTSVPIVSCYDGQSAVELVSSSNREDMLLFLMDWHMPGVCGLTATNMIRKIAKDQGGPSVYVCMVTADIEGLQTEMEKRQINCDGTISKGKLVSSNGGSDQLSTTSDESEEEMARRVSHLEGQQSGEFTVVDIVAEKPVTFQSIQAILTWFQEKAERKPTEVLTEVSVPS